MPNLSDGTYLFGSADHPRPKVYTMSYSADTVEAAYLEAIRRAHRYGGTWVVVPHPDRAAHYAVGLEGVVPGKPIRTYQGPSVSALIRAAEERRKK